MIDPKNDVLFIGVGDAASAWYRCYLPALHMGADWVGLYGDAPRIGFKTGLVRGDARLPDLRDYKVIVAQQAKGRGWFKVFNDLRRRHGTKVLFEVDDYLHAVGKKTDHQYAHAFGREDLKLYELNMQAADAIICSTDFLARKYRRFNARTFVCENGIDPARYRLTLPPRPTVNIGWSGATGHRDAVIPWLQEVARVMQQRDDTAFITIGQPFADGFREFFPNRCIATPFSSIETYPAAMTLFDVAIAPAGKDLFYRAKSDLRWLEAAALGIPIVADPTVYPEIEPGVTGLHATTPAEVHQALSLLVDDPDVRRTIGAAAKEYVLEHRTIDKLVSQWTDVFEEVV